MKQIITNLLILAISILPLTLQAGEEQLLNFISDAKVEVIYPQLGATGVVHIEFKIDAGHPGFHKGQAVEIGLMIIPKAFAAPQGGEDKNPSVGYYFLKDGNSLNSENSNTYRDVYNYSNDPHQLWDIGQNVVTDYIDEFCELTLFDKTLLSAINENLEAYFLTIADSFANFSVGTASPEIDLTPGSKYDIFYFIELRDNVKLDEGYAWIIASVMDDDCGISVDCPYLFGDIPLLGCHATNIVWHNRICVPTQKITFAPGAISSGTNFGTVCTDEDQDGLFAAQTDQNGNAIKMFGSNVGDCNDSRTNVDDTYYNPDNGECPNLCTNYLWDCYAGEWCDITQGLCMDCANGCSGSTKELCSLQCYCASYPEIAELQTPTSNQEFYLGEEIIFSFTPGDKDKYNWIRFKREPGESGSSIASLLEPGETTFSTSNIDFFDTPGQYHWVVYYYDECCKLNNGDGNCYSEVNYFTINETTVSDCKYPESANCGNCGTKYCQNTGKWGSCQDEGECSPGTIQSCTVGSITCDSNCNWPECPSTNCTPEEQANCGNCGTMTCSSNGEWSSCQYEGLCSPGQTQSTNCNETGTQERVCDETCYWGGWSTCSVSSCECTNASAPCCDGCDFNFNNVECDFWTKEVCSIDKTAIVYENTTQYCSGSNSECTGSTTTNWDQKEDCPTTSSCEIVNGNPVCVIISCECDNIYNPCCSDGCSFDPSTKVCADFSRDVCNNDKTKIITEYVETNCTGESNFCNGLPTVVNTTIKEVCPAGTICKSITAATAKCEAP